MDEYEPRLAGVAVGSQRAVSHHGNRLNPTAEKAVKPVTEKTNMTTERELVAARDAAIQQAQIWKMEAQSANATIAEIYRLVGSQAGNWNGAIPVRDYLAAHDAQPPTLPPVSDAAAALATRAYKVAAVAALEARTQPLRSPTNAELDASIEAGVRAAVEAYRASLATPAGGA